MVKICLMSIDSSINIIILLFLIIDKVFFVVMVVIFFLFFLFLCLFFCLSYMKIKHLLCIIVRGQH